MLQTSRIRFAAAFIVGMYLAPAIAAENADPQVSELRKLLANVPPTEDQRGAFEGRQRLFEIVKALGDNATATLGQILEDEDTFGSIRAGAAYALGELNDKRAEASLTNMLAGDLKDEAAEALGKIDDPELVDKLIALFQKDPEGEIAAGVFRTLRKMTRKSSVQKLNALTKHSNEALRFCAVEGLGRIADPAAVPSLIESLNDKNDGVVMKAAEALGNIGDPSASQALLRRVKGPGDMFLRRYLTDAMEAIKKKETEAFGTKAGQTLEERVAELAKAIADTDPANRRKAAIALRSIDDKPAPVLKALELALADDSVDVRNEAAETILQMGVPGSEILTRAIEDKRPEIRCLAINALIVVPKHIPFGTKYTPPVTAVAKRLKDDQAEVRRCAAAFLAQASDGLEVVIPDLIAALGDKDEMVNAPASVALGGAGQPAVKPLIEALSSGDAVVRARAAFALGQIGVAPTSFALSAMLDRNGGAKVSYDDVDTLRILPNAKEAIPALVKATKDPDMNVRALAIVSLGRMRSDAKECFEVIKRILQDEKEDETLRAAAATALGQIGADVASLLGSFVKNKNASQVMRGGAGMGLSKLGKAAVPTLTEILKTSEDDIGTAISLSILTRLGKDACDALPVIKELKNAPSELVRKWVEKAIESIPEKAE